MDVHGGRSTRSLIAKYTTSKKAYFRPIEFGSFIFLAFLNFCLLPLLYAVQLIRLKNNQLIDKNQAQPQLIVRNNNVTQESKKASQLQSRKQRIVS